MSISSDDKDNYVMVMHPWSMRQLLWLHRLSEGRYSYVWKAFAAQTYADWHGWGINEETL